MDAKKDMMLKNDLPDFEFGDYEEKLIKSFISGKVISILKAEGETVKKGEDVIMVETMKMEIGFSAQADGVISKIYVNPDEQISDGQELFMIE